jgi:integrase
MHTRLTQKYVDGLKNESGKDLFIRDSLLQGFGVKATPKSKIVYIVECRLKGAGSKRITLGYHPNINLKDAKRRANKALALLRNGQDPVKISRDLREEHMASQAMKEALSVTLNDLMESYFASRQLKSEQDYRKVLKGCFKDWQDKPVRDISRQLVEARFKKIAFKEGHKPQAAKAMRYLSAILTYGKAEIIQGESLISENPVDVLKEKRIDRSVKPKERHIQKRDLFKVIRAIMTECHKEARDLLLFQLFTGSRDSESKKLKWQDVDFINKTITNSENKSSRTHIIPMGSFIYALLLAKFYERRSKEYVFTNIDGSSHIGIVRKQVNKVINKTGITFSHHDLRRTYATLLEAELSVDESVVGRLLNHSPKTVTRKHYIKSSANRYTKEANALYKLICADHDWSSDDGERKGEGDFWSRVTGTDKEVYEFEFEGKFRQTLMMMLFDDSFQDLMKSEAEVDLQYIDEEMSVYTYLPWAYMERNDDWRKRVLGIKVNG